MSRWSTAKVELKKRPKASTATHTTRRSYGAGTALRGDGMEWASKWL